jgi:competence ComEA-like helix-hairpin-helix protein
MSEAMSGGRSALSAVLAWAVMAMALVCAPRLASAASKRLEGVVNLNTATADLLMLLPGLGPAKVETILLYRQRHPFRTVDELGRVKGIGRRMVKDLRPHLAVVGPSTATVTVVKTDLATLRRLETPPTSGADEGPERGANGSRGGSKDGVLGASREGAQPPPPRPSQPQRTAAPLPAPTHAGSGGQGAKAIVGGAEATRASKTLHASRAASARGRRWRMSVVPCLGDP